MSRLPRYGLAAGELGMLPLSLLHPLYHQAARSENDALPLL
jgi:hypothetical protein